MNEVGIEDIKESEVTKIISKNNKITGVQINNQNDIDANNVICNADPPAVYEKLLGKIKVILYLIGKKIEWNIPWDYLCIILGQKKYMRMLSITQ